MQADEREELKTLYETRYAELGRDVRTLGWKNSADQRLRFQLLCDIGDLRGQSVCDVGCGFGDLIPYLEERFGGFRYTGIDITPSLVDEASRQYPAHRFFCADILEDRFAEEHDYFLLSGALNYRVMDNWKLTTEMLALMFRLARRGVAVNFLTSYVNFQQQHNYHHQPEEIFRFARTLTPWVAIRHDYRLWEFTLHLLKQPITEEQGPTRND
jgi:SAM-dependent methyltransferase